MGKEYELEIGEEISLPDDLGGGTARVIEIDEADDCPCGRHKTTLWLLDYDHNQIEMHICGDFFRWRHRVC